MHPLKSPPILNSGLNSAETTAILKSTELTIAPAICLLSCYQQESFSYLHCFRTEVTNFFPYLSVRTIVVAEAHVDPTMIKKIVGHAGAMSLTEKVYTHLDIQFLVEAINKI